MKADGHKIESLLNKNAELSNRAERLERKRDEAEALLLKVYKHENGFELAAIETLLRKRGCWRTGNES